MWMGSGLHRVKLWIPELFKFRIQLQNGNMTDQNPAVLGYTLHTVQTMRERAGVIPGPAPSVKPGPMAAVCMCRPIAQGKTLDLRVWVALLNQKPDISDSVETASINPLGADHLSLLAAAVAPSEVSPGLPGQSLMRWFAV
jgi:hypothetical protein